MAERHEADEPATWEPADEGRAARLARGDWTRGEGLRGAVEGERLGAGVSVIFFATDEVGAGPSLHVHPYDEVFVVREGRALFTVGGTQIEAGPGDVVLGPARVPHKFRNLGPGPLRTTDIHASATWIQTDLPDPDGG